MFALTVCRGDPKSTRSWRLVLPLRPCCHRLLAVAGAVGRKLKATGEHWFLGHTVGRFESPSAPG